MDNNDDNVDTSQPNLKTTIKASDRMRVGGGGVESPSASHI